MSEPRKCKAIKASGGRCERLVRQSQDYCYSHDPNRVEERRRAASKAARAKGASGELAEIKDKLRSISEKVLQGEVSTAKGAVAAQVYGVLLRAYEQERKLKETEEFEERLAALEELDSA